MKSPPIISPNPSHECSRPNFVKLAAHFACQSVEPEYKKVFPRIQYGIGIPGGAQIGFHLIQRAIESSNQTAVIKFDVRNAFGTMKRSAIASTLLKNETLHPLVPIFYQLYGEATSALVYDSTGKLVARLAERESVKQGCRLAQLVYCATMQPHYEEAVDSTPDLIESVAYHDDFSAVTTPSALVSFARRWRATCERLGIVIGWPKTKVLWPHSNKPPTELADLCNEMGCELKCFTMDLLGGVVGLDRKKIAKLLTKQIKEDNERFFDVMNHPKLTVHTTRRLATQCGQPRLSYITRIHRRDDIRKGVKWFD